MFEHSCQASSYQAAYQNQNQQVAGPANCHLNLKPAVCVRKSISLSSNPRLGDTCLCFLLGV